jgi:hypothetical protein
LISPVPTDHRAGAVVACRNHRLEVHVLQRVILDLHGETLVVGIERWLLGDGPRAQHTVYLEA